MRKLLKWAGVVFGGLVGLVVLAAVGLYLLTTARLNKVYNVQADLIQIPTDAASIARGEVWVNGLCLHCHGYDLSGKVVFNDPMLATMPSANLTSGKGGIGEIYSDLDWIRAIRHGIGADGRTLVVMPSNDFTYFSDEDLGDIIAYLKTLPPVDHETSEPVFKPLGRVLTAAGAFGKIIPAELIDHEAVRQPAPPAEVTAEYGAYVVAVGGCRTCHGEDLTGGKDPDPNAPPAPNLSPTGDLGSWDEAGFVNSIRNGVTPSGKPLSAYMPWADFRNMSDLQLKAIWAYLASLPED